MGELFDIQDCTDAKRVGSVGAFLAQVARQKIHIVPGFVIPIDCQLKNGISNEILRRFDELKTDQVILRASLNDDFKDSEVLRNIPRERLIDSIVYMEANCARRHEKAAIIVQEMLNAEISGTAYSINPATRDAGEILIEAELWMGETVLTGERETNMILINKRSGAISLEDKNESDNYLSDIQITELYNAMRKIDHLCAFPAYIDWAFDHGKLHIIRLGPMDWSIYEEFNQ